MHVVRSNILWAAGGGGDGVNQQRQKQDNKLVLAKAPLSQSQPQTGPRLALKEKLYIIVSVQFFFLLVCDTDTLLM